MNIGEIIHALRVAAGETLDVHERQPGRFQVILPILHEDGDMVDIYLVQSPVNSAQVRICDFGMAVMRLSYTYEVNSRTRERIFNSILINNGVRDDSGNLYMDSPVNVLYQNILQFAGCVQKICNMRFWGRETVRSMFYEDLKKYALDGLGRFAPKPDVAPLIDYPPITVDWALTYNNRNLFLFGVKGNEKAKSTAISLLELKKADVKFTSLVVHDDIDALGRKERTYLLKNADKQYPDMEHFTQNAVPDIERMAA